MEEEWTGGGGERQVEYRESCGRYLVFRPWALWASACSSKLRAPSRLAGTAEGVGAEGVQMMHPSLWPHLDRD